MILRRLALLLLVAVVATGCNNQKTRELIDRRTDQTIRMGEEAQLPAAKKSFNPLVVTDKIWAGSASMRLRRGVPLPSKYESSRGVTLISADPLSMNEIATAISTQTGVPVRIASGQTSGGSASSSGSSSQGVTMPVSYEGPLSGLLDLVAGNFGTNWRYDGASINFSRFETRVFVIEALPGTQSIKDGMKDDSGGGGGGSGTTGGSFSASSSNSLQQSSEMSVELKVWDELTQTVTSMLGGIGSAVTAPSSGTITVTTTPDIMKTVAKFIEEENRRLSQQIAINVEIYAIALDEGTDFSFTFNEALRRLTNLGVGYASPSGPTAITSTFGATNIPTGGVDGSLTGLATGITTGSIEGGGNLAVAILNPKTVGQISGLFSALSTLGDTTRVAQFPVTTLNNRTASRRIGQDITYVASVSNTTGTSSSVTSTTVTPGTIREGFSIQLTPRLLQDGRILLQYSMSLIASLGDPKTFGTGSTQVQLPKTASRVFVQQSMLKSGSTLIIGGYDDETTTQTTQGVGNPYNYLLGGGASNSKARAMMFMAITPQVIEVPRGDDES